MQTYLWHIEAWAGAFMATILAVLCALMGLMLLLGNRFLVLPDSVYLLLIVAVTILIEGPFVWRVWAAIFRNERPIGPAVARRFRSAPVALRPAITLWWLGHVAVAMLAAAACTAGLDAPPAIDALLSQLFFFSIAVCVNVYIALAVKSLTGRLSAVRYFWDNRFAVDLALSIVALVLAKKL
jgi:hypothetical protein